MRPMLILSALILVLSAGVAATPEAVQAKQERKAVRFEFPTPITGFDFGDVALRKHIKDEKLTSRIVVEKTLEGMPYIFLVDVIRKLSSDATEFAALNKEIEDANLNSVLSGTRYAAGVFFDKKSVSERNIIRAFSKVVEEFEPEEAAAMLVKIGYNERWILARLKATDTSHNAYKKLEREYKDADDADDVWDDLNKSATFELAAERWLNASGSDTLKPITELFDDADKKTTPALTRLIAFRDSALLARHLTANGFKVRDFVREVEDYLKDLKKTSASTAKVIATRMLDYEVDRLDMGNRWDFAANKDAFYALYAPRGGPPSLDNFKAKKWEALDDFGISTSILSAETSFVGTLVIDANKSVRGSFGGSRFEGVIKGDSLTLVARDGGADRRFKDMKLFGGGLFRTMARELEKDKTRPLYLRRVPFAR